MSFKESLPFRNLTRKPGRTVPLMILSAFLSAAMFIGSILVISLQNGLSSLNSRLGADIMVVPYEATTKRQLDNIILNGNTGYFYMSDSVIDQIKKVEGTGQISSQFFLASASSGCCSLPVQIIGFDPETDFVIQPWLKKSFNKKLTEKDIIVGNDLNAFVGDTLTFYNVECKVVGKLDKTGTTMDTTVYTNEDTIKLLIRSAYENKLNDFGNIDPDHVVSCVMVNVDDEHNVEEVLNNINIHVKNIGAVQSKNMITNIASSLNGVSTLIGILMVAVWILSAAILMISFKMITRERVKEFAVLRVLGASRKKISSLILQEGALNCLAGALIGVVLGALITIPFGSLIESQLGLPYLLPSFGILLLIVVLAIGMSVLTGSLAASRAAYAILKTDTGLILREEN
ncbi:MAG: ABC transporter permease [Faecalicoccus sp.]|nr:ABC transporter permease [Faecalicoccus sp.]